MEKSGPVRHATGTQLMSGEAQWAKPRDVERSKTDWPLGFKKPKKHTPLLLEY